MKLFVVALTLLVSSLRHQCSTAAKNAGIRFWRSGDGLPGPSMSFDVCLGTGTFEFQFKTFVKRALVLYQDDQGYSDYLELTLQDGRIYLAFNLVQDWKNRRNWLFPRLFRSEKRYNDFEWHKVKIVRTWHETSIYVDDESKTFESRGRSTFESKLQVGGFSPERLAKLNEISKQTAWKLYATPFNK